MSVTATITNMGLNLIRDALAVGAIPQITYMAIGTGTSTPAKTDTILQEEVFRKRIGVTTNGTNPGEVILTFYLAPQDAAGVTIGEIGFFGGANATDAPNTGTLIARANYNYMHPSDTNNIGIQVQLEMSI
jgi:phage-related tail fiber protein